LHVGIEVALASLERRFDDRDPAIDIRIGRFNRIESITGSGDRSDDLQAAATVACTSSLTLYSD
jgi:hypothetical protein